MLPDLLVNEIELLSQVGDLDTAIRLATSYLEMFEDEFGDDSVATLSVELALLYLRRDQKAAAKEILDDLAPPKLKDKPQTLLRAARLARWCGGGKGVEFAFEAWRNHQADSDIQIEYGKLALTARKEERSYFAAPSAVGVDVSVTLTVGEKTITVTLLHDDAARKLAGEISQDSELGTGLVGAREGDTLEVENLLGSADTYTVDQIESKYSFAVRQALNEQPFLSPGSRSIMKFQFDKDDPHESLVPIFASIENRARHVEQKLRPYRNGELPLLSLPKLIGSSVYQLWLGLTTSDEERVFASSGAPNEFGAMTEQIAQSKGLVSDYISLLTLEHLELLQLVDDAFEEVVVAQDTLDDLLRVVRADSGAKTGGTFMKVRRLLPNRGERP